MKAVVLLSGGMDSCVTLAWAVAEGYEPAVLHVNYGQRTQQRELQAFNDIAEHYNVEQRLVVDISHLAAIGGSSLTDRKLDIPIQELENSKTRELEKENPLSEFGIRHSASGIPNTYVPFRNGNILAIAASWAEVLEAGFLCIGAVEEDSSGSPDCREVFLRAFEQAINLGKKEGNPMRILAPLIHLSKSDIVRLGTSLKAPFHLSWSCYKEQDIACGLCESCLLRLKGFSVAGLEDPIKYEIAS